MKKKNNTPEHYHSLDAPVFIWQRVHETQDVSWLLMKRQKVSRQILSKLESAWENIYNEYINEFGFSEAFLSIKRKEIHIAQMKVELVLTGDRSLLTFIEIEEEELQEMKQAVGKSNFMESKIAIENKFKFQINMMTTSIKEFYSYLKHLK